MAKRRKEKELEPSRTRAIRTRQLKPLVSDDPVKKARYKVVTEFPNLEQEDLDDDFYMAKMETWLRYFLPGKPEKPFDVPGIREELERQVASPVPR